MPQVLTGELIARADEQCELIRVGKDELNLIEHPFAAIWDKKEEGSVIHHEWEARHPKTGKIVKAFWRVIGDPEKGLPKPSDERLYLVLLELTREAAFQSQSIHFSRHHLLKRLGWGDGARSYQMLYDAFDRLKSVSITSRNAFWNPQAKSFRSVGFSIIDNFDILVQEPGRKPKTAELQLSFFKWNDVLFESFQNGYIRTLNLGFALSLKGDISLRLYRYLDKKSYDGRPTFEIGLETLCERHLAMRTAKYPSTLKARLEPAHRELIGRGFLDSVRYSTMKDGKSQKVCYRFPSKTRAVRQRGSDPALDASPEQPRPEQPRDDVTPTNDALQLDSTAMLLERMKAIKVSPEVARGLLESAPPELLRVQLDCLEDREPRDRAATFVKSVREAWQVPAKYLERQEAQERAERARVEKETQKERAAQERASTALKRASQEEESAQLDAAWEKLDPESRERIDHEARERMGVLGRSRLAPAGLQAMRRNLLREQLKADR